MLLTTGQAPPYCFIFQMFRKTRIANGIKTSSRFQDFRLKYCGKEFLQLTFLHFLFPQKSQRQ